MWFVRSGKALSRGLPAVLLCLLLLLPAMDAGAQDRRPLLMEGKKTLFQRVLTRPGAILRQEGRADAPAVGQPLPAFEMFFVYGREGDAGRGWIEVGRRDDGRPEGWIQSSQVIDWKQTIVVAFNNPAARGRSLLFNSRETLTALIQSKTRIADTQRFREAAILGTPLAESGVVSIEPDTYVDITRQFYLLPIFDHQQEFIDGRRSFLLHVASAPKSPPAPLDASRAAQLANFRIGVTFVIDTTKSMGPYIDRTREAVDRIYQQIKNSPIGDRTSFGLIGFRDGTKAANETGYVTQTFVPLKPDQTPSEVLSRMAEVKATKVSTRGFTEDSLAGIVDGIDGTDWEPFGGRYIILVTDAGPLPGKDPAARIRETPAQINSRAAERKIAIFTLHLLTPDGAADHRSAEAAYRDLSRFQNSSLYYGIPDGDPARFGEQVDLLTKQLIQQVQDTQAGRLTEPAAAAGAEADPVALVGRAMQLAYLGRVEGTAAPDLIDAWISEYDLEDPRKRALDIRLLITKNQLSSMTATIKTLVDEYNGNRVARQDGEQLFARLRSAIALMTRTPDRVGSAEFSTLGDAFGEFLEGLPFDSSEILSMTADEWGNLGGARQRQIIDTLEQRVAHYEALHRTAELWVPLYDGAPDGDRVYAMPYDDLP